MEADGGGAVLLEALTGVDEIAWPPADPAAAAAALPDSELRKSFQRSGSELDCFVLAERRGASARRPRSQVWAAAGGAVAPTNFAWFVALTASGIAGAFAGGAACFGSLRFRFLALFQILQQFPASFW